MLKQDLVFLVEEKKTEKTKKSSGSCFRLQMCGNGYGITFPPLPNTPKFEA